MLYRVVSQERFPIWLHTVAVAIAGVILCWFGWNGYAGYRTTAVTIAKIEKIKELQTTITHLDEVLTMSARMAAATGERRWEERYRQFEPQWDAAIKEAIQLAPDVSNALAAAQTDAANSTLVEMEKRGFDLVHQGYLEEARTLLSSAEYEEQKRLYGAGMTQFAALLHAATQTLLQSQAHRAFFNITVTSVAIPLALIGWLMILQAMRRWMAGISLARAQAQQAEQALQKAHDDLESRVRERTCALERANQQLHTEITGRQRIEAALRASEERLAHIVATNADGIMLLDQEGHYMFVNPAAERLTGLSRSVIMQRTYDDPAWKRTTVDGQPLPNQEATFAQVIRTGEPVYGVEYALERPDGTQVMLSLNAAPLRDAAGALTGVVTSLSDRTAYKQIERRLRASEARKSAIVESALDCIITIDQEGQIVEFNPAAEKTFGYPRTAAIGQKIDELIIPPSLREQYRHGLAHYLASGEGPLLGKRVEMPAIRADGTELSVEITVTCIRCEGPPMFTGFVRDITERRQLENQLIQAQKMQAIGTLVGGIAHDFNNILGAILGYTKLTMDDVAPDSMAAAKLQHVLMAAQRAKDLVQRILTFSRHTAQERRPTQLHLLIKEVIALLRASLPSTIEIQKYLARDMGHILADPTQIHQVVMNLCINATHAMRDTGGVLEIRLDGIDVDANLAASLPPLHPGAHVRLTVRDTGHGMTPEVVKRIFEPFFTTKEPGEGTGMGLAVVHGIIAAHEGAITVESWPGHGTTFVIYLPQIATTTDSEAPRQEPTPTGTERILLVDDEAALAHTSQALLSRLGYDVVVCTSGLEALEAFRAAPQHFDLVITDQTMPYMTGEGLATALCRIRPDVSIILCTGFSHTMTTERARDLGIDAFCMKPLMATTWA